MVCNMDIKNLLQEFDQHLTEYRYEDAYGVVQKMRQAIASGETFSEELTARYLNTLEAGVKLMGGF